MAHVGAAVATMPLKLAASCTPSAAHGMETRAQEVKSLRQEGGGVWPFISSTRAVRTPTGRPKHAKHAGGEQEGG